MHILESSVIAIPSIPSMMPLGSINIDAAPKVLLLEIFTCPPSLRAPWTLTTFADTTGLLFIILVRGILIIYRQTYI